MEVDDDDDDGLEERLFEVCTGFHTSEPVVAVDARTVTAALDYQKCLEMEHMMRTCADTFLAPLRQRPVPYVELYSILEANGFGHSSADQRTFEHAHHPVTLEVELESDGAGLEVLVKRWHVSFSDSLRERQLSRLREEYLLECERVKQEEEGEGEDDKRTTRPKSRARVARVAVASGSGSVHCAAPP